MQTQNTFSGLWHLFLQFPSWKNNASLIYLLLPLLDPKYRTHFQWDSKWNQFLRRGEVVTLVPLVSLVKQIMLVLSVLLLSLVSKVQKPSSSGLKPKTVCWSCGLCFCDLLAKTNNYCPDAILLMCLVSKLQKPSSPGFKTRAAFQSCGLCICNLLYETNNFGSDAVLLLSLVSDLQEPPSIRTQTQDTFSRVLTFLYSLPGLKE